MECDVFLGRGLTALISLVLCFFCSSRLPCPFFLVPSSPAETFWFLPLVVPLGKTIQTYVGLSNRDARAYRVTGVAGSLNRVEGFRTYVQNLTVAPFNRTVEPGSEASFSYTFSLNDRLDVRSYRLALTVFYQRASMATGSASASARHSATFYNATISTVDNSSVMDGRTFAIGAVVVLGGIAAAVAAIRGSHPDGDAPTAAGTSTKAPVEMGTASGDTGDDEDEWLSEHRMMRGSKRVAK